MVIGFPSRQHNEKNLVLGFESEEWEGFRFYAVVLIPSTSNYMWSRVSREVIKLK